MTWKDAGRPGIAGPGVLSGHIQSWSLQAPMYAEHSGETLISSASGVSQTSPFGRWMTLSLSSAVTGCHLLSSLVSREVHQVLVGGIRPRR